MYSLEYLPAALRDMVEIAQYISQVLDNPAAASRLSEDLIQAGESIPAFPYANPAYIPLRPLKHEYRKLLIHNYLMLYWVDEHNKTVTIARVVYAKSNYPSRLE